MSEFLGTEDLVKGGNEGFGSRIGDAVMRDLAFMPERHQAVLAHQRQMLGQRRWRQAEGLGHLADPHFTNFDQFVQHHQAAVIDPVLDFDPASGRVSTGSADAVLAAAREGGWVIALVLETHAHADHLTAAPHIKAATGAKIGIGALVTEVQAVFAPVFGASDIKPGGTDFDLLLHEGEAVALGELEIAVMHTPGHTPACIAYRIGDAVFVGDTLFMPDYGTARADFPDGDARALYRSIRRILALPDATRLFLCHDYKAPGRDDYVWETTVAAQRAGNVHIHDGIDEDAFVAMRNARDAGLAAPRLLLPSIQVNIRAGRLPPDEANGTHYLKIPLRLPAAT